jgi:DNA invertase Pin-like site-specific DNA recombinase
MRQEAQIKRLTQDKPMSQLLLSMLGAVAEFERAMIRERQREGIELAKKKGVYKGRKPSLSAEQIEQIRTRIRKGEGKAKLAKVFKVSRQSIYNALERTASAGGANGKR